MKIIYALFFTLLLSMAGLSQEKMNNNENKVQFNLEGMIGASFGKNFYTINLGGPTLMLGVSKNLKLGIGAVPSLYSEG